MWRNLVLLYVTVQWLFLRDGPLAVDLVWTVWNLSLWSMLKLKWWYELKFLCTQGRRPRITTIGKMYMGIKDGVLSIWYPFSKKLELYVPPIYLGTNYYGVYRQKLIKQFQRIQPMASRGPSKSRLCKIPGGTSAKISFLLLRNLIRSVVR